MARQLLLLLLALLLVVLLLVQCRCACLAPLAGAGTPHQLADLWHHTAPAGSIAAVAELLVCCEAC
jgi:hypothetical protein